MTGLETAHTRFDPAAATPATAPPEARGLARDEVRLLVATPAGVRHARFADLPDHLEPGDLLVVNNSATLPAAVDGRRAGRPITVHFAARLDDGHWLVELRPPGRATGPVTDALAGEWIDLPGGAGLLLGAPHRPTPATTPRLWHARVRGPVDLHAYLAAHGRPISYAYVDGQWPLSAYQTVFAAKPGSAEMPSAARPFSTAVVTELVSRGVLIAPITLHTSVSSLEVGEAPPAEPYSVPSSTARLVQHVRNAGGRVVAVGTTAARALETVSRVDGSVHAGEGWTELVLGPQRPARVVDGLITGWHDAGASHLLLLEAVAGPELVDTAYAEAVRERYLWHEFGDSCLLLPARRRTARHPHTATAPRRRSAC